METTQTPRAGTSAGPAAVVKLFDTLAPNAGFTPSCLDGVKFMRANRPMPRMPVLYEPSIVIVCQGRKRGYLGDKTYPYDAQQYLVLSVPLPFECETEASLEEPFLGISVRVDLTVVAELLMALNETHGTTQNEPRGIYSTPLDPAHEQCRAASARSAGLAARRAHSRAGHHARDLLSRADRRAGRCDPRGAHASASLWPHREGAAPDSCAITTASSTSIRSRAKPA